MFYEKVYVKENGKQVERTLIEFMSVLNGKWGTVPVGILLDSEGKVSCHEITSIHRVDCSSPMCYFDLSESIVNLDDCELELQGVVSTLEETTEGYEVPVNAFYFPYILTPVYYKVEDLNDMQFTKIVKKTDRFLFTCKVIPYFNKSLDGGFNIGTCYVKLGENGDFCFNLDGHVE